MSLKAKSLENVFDAPPAANDNVTRWNRWDNLPKGHRFYSSPDWVRWYHGMGKPETWSFVEDDDWELRPELPLHYHVLDLDSEPTEKDPLAWRYMSLTQRFERFCDIISAARHPGTRYPRPTGAVVKLGEYGPSAEWRERAQAIWAKLPKNDSDIFDRPARPVSPKHGQMAEQLSPLLRWAKASRPLLLDGTNWLQPDNDGYFDGEEPAPKPATNWERRMRPGSSDAELKAFIGKARAGKLKPSNGSQHESCHVRKGGKTVKGSVRMPLGAILYQEDRFAELKGEEPDYKEIERRQGYWTSLFSSARAFRSHDYYNQELEPVRYVKAGRIRRKVKLTKAEQLELLAGPLPPVTYCKPGLPCGHEDIGASFLGGWISATKGARGMDRWEDLSDELSRQEELEVWADALPPEQQKALNLGAGAANFREIGEAFAKTGKAAERYGKAIVIASNDNLRKAIAA
ncbi:hypothetical protein [Aminobacter sp. AP02]|uniref:hypothetical protein n=1 Tax=Aminobacter sp. AP02 TaxID=2135737 RepID=UPI000D7A8C74|nr:hypothetical protein [Aminobacter sp. AP02]PWK65856.1 hypothetical protein C8K44_11571 [Aminobacter sp. AP02]